MKTTKMAHYLVSYFQLQGIPISPLKLQKLLYYIQAWHITLFKRDQLYNELPQAWVNGPAYATVYAAYKSKFAKNTPIVEKGVSDKELSGITETAYEALNLKKDQYKFLNAVIGKYGSFTDEKLVYLTHIEKPWNDARKGLDTFAVSTAVISVESMYNYYSARVKA